MEMQNTLTRMDQPKASRRAGLSTSSQFVLAALFLIAILLVLFWKGMRPGYVVFSNDGPLAIISAACSQLPAGFTGNWQDLSWLGGAEPSASPDVSALLATAVGPLIFAKIYPAFALLFLGLSAWLCFRQWKFSSTACIVGALGACLNSDFFSTACWGVAAQPLSFGCDFLALAALADETSPKRWLRVILAGFAVGVGVMEAFDIGAMFSVVVAAYVVYQGLISAGTALERVTRAFSRLAIVAVFAGFIAAAAVTTLIATQIKGVEGMGQDTQSKLARWDQATQWSLPKREVLSLVVPGLFGFRMDTPDGGNYWGANGRDAAWDRWFASDRKEPPPDARQFFLRYGGGGIYAGVSVALIALWAVLQAFRRENSIFSLAERKYIWFWVGVAVVCALVGFGRFAPFYQFFYALPFASTMRNPSKFYHVVSWMIVILFAYGLNGLGRLCLDAPSAAAPGLSSALRSWWARATAFDRKWVLGTGIALGGSLVAWLIFAASREKLAAYLKEMGTLEGRGPEDASAMANAIASYSIGQVGWYILFLALAAVLVAIFMSGFFSGRRLALGSVLLGLLVVSDLGLANRPWVIAWNWVDKYASNPVIELLRKNPYEHRVAVLPFRLPPQMGIFSQLYDSEWKQQLFRFNNIQSLDIVMMPRQPADRIGFESAMEQDGTTNTLHRTVRRWELTNTRYLLGPAAFLQPMNHDLDPEKQRFKYLARFDLGLKPGVTQLSSIEDVTADITPEGQFAVIDFTGALPRAGLYSNWQVVTNDQKALAELGSASFDPHKVVLVANPIPASSPRAGATNTAEGTVEFVSYKPKDIVLKAQAAAPSVLLLNDRYDSNWHVTVDGKPEPLLRCNYLMRGVQVPAGSHTVEFRYQPPIGPLYISIAAVVVAIVLIGYLAFGARGASEKTGEKESRPTDPDLKSRKSSAK
jgi:hypothetical protein